MTGSRGLMNESEAFGFRNRAFNSRRYVKGDVGMVV